MLISFLISMLKVCAAIDDSRAFKSCEEFKTFLRLEGSSEVQQFASAVWQAGYHSCASIARSGAELRAQHGSDIRQLLDFCRLHSGTCQPRENFKLKQMVFVDDQYWPCDSIACVHILAVHKSAQALQR